MVIPMVSGVDMANNPNDCELAVASFTTEICLKGRSRVLHPNTYVNVIASSSLCIDRTREAGFVFLR